MEFKQRRNSNRIHYVFGEDEVQYTLQDSSGSRSFSVDYTDISRDRQTLEERNQWLGNVGLLWLALGAVLTAMQWFGDQVFKPSFWLFIGAGCYAVYWFRRTRFTILPTEKGNLLVIDDATGPKILEQITTRRAANFRRDYDGLRPDEPAQQQHNRFKCLHREGALTDEELQQRLAMIEPETALYVGHDDEAPKMLLN